jgi:hypothetical protein
MTSATTLRLSGGAGKQKPTAFEGGDPDVLSASLGAGSSEPASLASTLTVKAEERLEIKALG